MRTNCSEEAGSKAHFFLLVKMKCKLLKCNACTLGKED